MCVTHRSCQAGEWTVSTGTVEKDTGCEACPAGTARPSAPGDKVSVETASSCPACTGASEYSDESGLKACKACSAGHFGVVVSGSNADGGHEACDDGTCARPTHLPANSMVVEEACPERGEHGNDADADKCALACKAGFYSVGAGTPFTCAPDGETTTASYQGGTLSCAGG